MNKSIPYLIIAALLVVIFLQNSCESTPKQKPTVVVPAVVGSSPVLIPVNIPVSINRPVYQSAPDNEFIQEQIDLLLLENEQLAERFSKESDSLKLVIYNQAIAINHYSQTFEDEFVFLSAEGLARGEVKTMKFDYKIKERIVDVPPAKEMKFRFLGGIEMGNSLQFDQFAVKGNLLFQNAKGNILSGSFDTEQRIWLGYNFSIFTFKK